MRSLWVPAAAALLAAAMPASAETGHSVTLPDSLKWGDAPIGFPPGSQMVVLLGDPGAEGPFVLRWKAPAGFFIPAHSHPTDETLTVLSGSMMMAMGDNLRRETAVEMPAGSFFQLPQGMPHVVWVTEPLVLEVHASGPFDIKYLDPSDDPRLQTAKK